MLKSILLATTIILSTVAASFANPDDDFQTALDLWLEGNDETSLLALSALANDGYTDAQILLAQIERSSSFTSDFVTGLTRKERTALLRMPGGLSGKSWLVAARENSDLAAAFLDVKSVETRYDAAISLYELGEIRAADETIMQQFNYGIEPLFELAAERRLPVEIMPIVTMMAKLNMAQAEPFVRRMIEMGNFRQELSRADEIRGSQIAPIWIPAPNGSGNDLSNIMTGRVLEEWNIPAASIREYEDWIVTHPLLDVLRIPCERLCPDEVTACSRVAYAAIPYRETFTMGSPVETLISQDRYLHSERAAIDIVSNWVDRLGTMETLPKASACFAEHLASELARRN